MITAAIVVVTLPAHLALYAGAALFALACGAQAVEALELAEAQAAAVASAKQAPAVAA